jgi:hypothetical protein
MEQEHVSRKARGVRITPFPPASSLESAEGVFQVGDERLQPVPPLFCELIGECMDTARRDEPVGATLDRNITQGEQVDGELEHFIAKRHDDRVRKEERVRAEEMAWKASVRKYNRAKAAELRAEWSEYHREQAERHKAVLASLIEHHEAEASKLGGDAA